MRKRIRAIAEGKFKYKDIPVHVSVERIELMAKKDEVLKGSFMLESDEDDKLQGLIYTTDRRMTCEDVQFTGRKVKILYQFQTKGMEEGETNKGDIYIESNAGEVVVPYVVSIERSFVMTSVGKIRDLYHFANLAQKSFQEAYKLFCSKKFLHIQMDEDARQLYQAMSQSHVSKENMEEFLIAVRKKEPMRFVLHTEEENYYSEGDSFKKTVTLSKNTWGYFSIQVQCDADFIYTDKPVITSDDFVGNHYDWDFIVQQEKLHAGRNLARITFSSSIQTEIMTVEIGVPSVKSHYHEKEAQLVSELCELYIRVRNHDIKDEVWRKEGLRIAESLSGIRPEHTFYMLFQAQMYAMAQRGLEAVWILNKFQNPISMRDEQPEVYAYYEYVNALIKQEEEFTDIVRREIVELSEKHPVSFDLLRLRLFIDKGLDANKMLKYRLLKQQFTYGCRSPFLYLEACQLMKRDLSVFHRLEAFECQVLIFALRHGMLEDELVEKAAQLAVRLKEFEPLVYQLLSRAYEMHPSKTCVEAVCSMLIRANRRNSKYFVWFERGVEEGLKLTQLFEYYMYTLPSERREMLPKTLLMYFNFDSALDYKRKAYLYANVWKYRERLGDLFNSYEPRIKIFIIEQIMRRHIDENLAYLYWEFSGDIFKDYDASVMFEELVFTKKLYCPDSNIRHVIVRHGELNREEIFPIIDQTAWIKTYHGDALILLEDKEGRRHKDTIRYYVTDMVKDGELARYCLHFEKIKLGILLNRYRRMGTELGEGTSALCERLLGKKQLTREFAQEVRKQLIEYYMETRQYERAAEHLELLDAGILPQNERAHFVELMITQGMYGRAYRLILEYGTEQIRPKRLVRMCSRLIDEDDVEEHLLELCFEVFSKGKYDERILEYLTRYFFGPTWQMDMLWRAAKKFDVETYGIGERVLIQMLFTGYLLPDSGEVFEDYYKPGYKVEIVQAYLAFFSYYYVLHDQIIDERIIHWIEREYCAGECINLDCKATLLKYYAQMQKVPEDKLELLEEVMRGFVEEGILFPFFTTMDKRLASKFCLDEKTIIEHRASPDKRVFLYYLICSGAEGADVYRKEEMERIYSSIFVKEITLFYGERLQYYIVETNQDGSDACLCMSAQLEHEKSIDDENEGRYWMLSAMAASYEMQDEVSLYELLERYEETEKIVEQLFTLE